MSHKLTVELTDLEARVLYSHAVAGRDNYEDDDQFRRMVFPGPEWPAGERAIRKAPRRHRGGAVGHIINFDDHIRTLTT